MPSKNRWSFLLCVVLLSSCASSKYLNKGATKALSDQLDQPIFNYHLGLLIQDLESGLTVYTQQADQYFTPASNTKILSLAVGLEVLGDSIPFGRLIDTGAATYLQPYGDPTFLHPDYDAQPIYDRLRRLESEEIIVDLTAFQEERYGSGWSWDDYNGAYQIERGALPMYGHYLLFEKGAPTLDYFADQVTYIDAGGRARIVRDRHANMFKIYGDAQSQNLRKAIPLKIDDEVTLAMLQDTLNTVVSAGQYVPPPMARVSSEMLYSRPVDSLFIPMMQRSDNFFADQILIMAGQQQLGHMTESDIIAWAKDQWTTPDELLWYDGSGLSRYNQFTPRSLVYMLRRLQSQYGLDRVLRYMPAGGQSGTINSWFGSPDSPPFIFAKTGTLRNVYCLSGYLRGDSGRWYVFSWMNNNFPGGSATVKKPMEEVLRFLKTKL